MKNGLLNKSTDSETAVYNTENTRQLKGKTAAT